MSLGTQDMAAMGASGKMRMCQEEFDIPLAFQATGYWLCLELIRERFKDLTCRTPFRLAGLIFCFLYRKVPVKSEQLPAMHSVY